MSEHEDDLLLEQLRATAAEADPVPEPVLAAARGSYTWRTIDAELAELAYDSVLDAEGAALVRSGGAGGEARLLTFEAIDLTIEVEVSAAGAERHLVGQLVPASPAIVEVRHPGGEVAVEVDRLGRFAAGPIGAGAVSLRCRRAGPTAVATVKTEWVTI
jgi:hypothetical protein